MSTKMEILASLAQHPGWQALKELINTKYSPEAFLSVKEEMGVAGFWYTKGAVEAGRHIIKVVEGASARVKKD